MHPPLLACYISAHGFGHLAQCVPVLLALRQQLPNVRLIIRSDIPAAMLHRRLVQVSGGYAAESLIHLPGAVDVGVQQAHAAAEDWPASCLAVRVFHADWEQRVQQECRILQQHGVQAVLSNIAPLGLAAAQQSAIPSIAMCCLDWCDIYRGHLADDEPAMQQMYRAYHGSSCLLHLQPGMPMSSFPHRLAVPPLVREAEARDLCRADLSCSDERPLALVMFGGTQQPPFDLQGLAAIPEWDFLIPGLTQAVAENIIGFNADALSTRDVMQLADVTVCKPGYGTWAEAWLTATPVMYIARPGFAEYPYLRAWLNDVLPSYCLGDEDFRHGRWQTALHALQGAKNTALCQQRDNESRHAATLAATEIATRMVRS